HRPSPLRRRRRHRHAMTAGCSDNLRQSLIERADAIRYVSRSARDDAPPSSPETRMKRRHFASLGAVLVGLAAVAGGPAMAQTKVVWKASDVHPLGYPTVEAIVRMGKKLEAQTNGRISIQMYPSMQLGGEKEMIEQAQVGALQIAR